MCILKHYKGISRNHSVLKTPEINSSWQWISCFKKDLDTKLDFRKWGVWTVGISDAWLLPAILFMAPWHLSDGVKYLHSAPILPSDSAGYSHPLGALGKREYPLCRGPRQGQMDLPSPSCLWRGLASGILWQPDLQPLVWRIWPLLNYIKRASAFIIIILLYNV